MLVQELRRQQQQQPSGLLVIELMLLPFVELHIVRLTFATFDKTVASIASATSAAST